MTNQDELRRTIEALIKDNTNAGGCPFDTDNFIHRIVALIKSEKAELMADIVLLVNHQAEDEGLWFIAPTISEGYLQRELRRLHALIEHQAKKKE